MEVDPPTIKRIVCWNCWSETLTKTWVLPEKNHSKNSRHKDFQGIVTTQRNGPFLVQPKYMGVSKNRGTPKSSILKRFSIINHPFWGTPIFGNIHMALWIRDGWGDFTLLIGENFTPMITGVFLDPTLLYQSHCDLRLMAKLHHQGWHVLYPNVWCKELESS